MEIDDVTNSCPFVHRNCIRSFCKAWKNISSSEHPYFCCGLIPETYEEFTNRTKPETPTKKKWWSFWKG